MRYRILYFIPKEKRKMNRKSATSFSNKTSPKVSRKKLVQKVETKNSKLDKWLQDKGVIPKTTYQNKTRILNLSSSEMSVASKKNGKLTSKQSTNKSNVKTKKQSVLTSLVTKVQTCTPSKSIKKTSSSESCDLPLFKISQRPKKENKLYKKYGVVLPTVEELLKEKEDLENYKNQLEQFDSINQLRLELSTYKENLQTEPVHSEHILDCKHLSLQIILKYLKKNLKHLQDIMYKRVYNERHERFNNKYKQTLTPSTSDLTYNTSMIVFTYDQIEFMIEKLKKYLDPEDQLTQYFFQVLLPELCLKIFMQTHNMSFEEAVIYLDKRPL